MDNNVILNRDIDAHVEESIISRKEYVSTRAIICSVTE